MSWLTTCSLLVLSSSLLMAQAPQGPAAVRLLDVTGDGLLDELSCAPDGSVAVAINVGSKTFIPIAQDLPRVSVADVLVTDLDEDGLPDLYLVSLQDNVALLGDGSGHFRDATKALQLGDAGRGQSATRTDVDGDGLLDLLLHNMDGDVLFWATSPGRYERGPSSPATADPVDLLATIDTEQLALLLAMAIDGQGGWTSGGVGAPGLGSGESLLPGPGTGGMTMTGGGPGIAGTAPPPTLLPSIMSTLDDTYVNDDRGEVDSADIADGSLTGADVSTSSGNVMFPGAVLTAQQGVFGTGSSVTGQDSVVSGGQSNTASNDYATVSGGKSNIASNEYATVGGGSTNLASGLDATVSGGRVNTASGFYATVGGGFSNTASGNNAVVGGGWRNAAQGGANATVGGGTFNFASAQQATVGGGDGNTASASNSTVGGGRSNWASADFATIPGGWKNSAFGDYSFAAGRRAKADHDGAFVWGDSIDGNKSSSAPDEFNVYASGGARIFSNSAATSGVTLAPGGNSWSAVSDRHAKEHFEPVDARAVLEAVAAMPITTWNYKTQDDAVRHMGPMAQDFRAAFGLGISDRLIDTIDPDGVALAAIQGLNELVAEKDAEIAELRERQARMEEQLAKLMRR